jgi:membrane-bound lytic murein transglycosylase D
MRFFAAVLILFGVAASYAQTPEVPRKMYFAGIALTIRDDARQEIQADVDALTKSAKHFNMKVERAKSFFPFIEQIFAEERLPDDFKYLVLQESALVSDAVSVSNAVGFWQFKDFTAQEMGLRVDKEIDERMNLISSSRGAAKYLKKNNTFFNNWLLALQAYQMGAGGVQRAIGDKYNGDKQMDITADTYWYVKKYLAHKVAFENALKGEPQIKMKDLTLDGATSIAEVAKKLSMDEAQLLEYNKWVRKGDIPADRKYTLLVPMGNLDEDFTKLALSTNSVSKKQENETKEVRKTEVFLINDIPTIKAKPGELLTALADRANISVSDFLAYNDISIDHHITPGAYYFTGKKKKKASEPFHQLQEKETLWMISQRYGVQLKRLRKYNRVNDRTQLMAGTQIWLSARAPEKEAFVEAVKILEVSEAEHFEWSIGVSKVKAKDRTETQVATQQSASDVAVLTKQEQLHTVRQGETLYSIARNYMVNVSDLIQWNELDPQHGIKSGQLLRVLMKDPIMVKEKEQNVVSDQYHEIQSADTLYSVARQYGVTIKELMDWNSKTDFSVSVGEKLRVSPQ